MTPVERKDLDAKVIAAEREVNALALQMPKAMLALQELKAAVHAAILSDNLADEQAATAAAETAAETTRNRFGAPVDNGGATPV